MGQCINYLETSKKLMTQKGSRVHHFIKFGIPKKLFRLIKMCLNEAYNEVCKCKNLSDAFPVQNGLKQDALSLLL